MVVAGGWWVAIVELWPASSRPYIGGSTDNSLLQLALGYNGLQRLAGGEGGLGPGRELDLGDGLAGQPAGGGDHGGTLTKRRVGAGRRRRRRMPPPISDEKREAVLEALRPYEAIWQLGDVVGYGPNPRECVDIVRKQPPMRPAQKAKRASSTMPSKFQSSRYSSLGW